MWAMSEPSAGDSPRVQAALAGLRRRGERITPARCAVLRVIDAADRTDEHLTAEQVGSRVAEREPGIHRATVYRTLTSLTDAGLLSHVHLGGSGTVYHLVEEQAGAYAAGPGPAPELAARPHEHAHVQCVSCGKVVDVPPDALDEVAGRLLAELGFRLDTAHAALLGHCSDCD
jgi:Fur family ferric uptake transcriptional regulator